MDCACANGNRNAGLVFAELQNAALNQFPCSIGAWVVAPLPGNNGRVSGESAQYVSQGPEMRLEYGRRTKQSE
jgi:hypothetical protein